MLVWCYGDSGGGDCNISCNMVRCVGNGVVIVVESGVVGMMVFGGLVDLLSCS